MLGSCVNAMWVVERLSLATSQRGSTYSDQIFQTGEFSRKFKPTIMGWGGGCGGVGGELFPCPYPLKVHTYPPQDFFSFFLFFFLSF